MDAVEEIEYEGLSPSAGLGVRILHAVQLADGRLTARVGTGQHGRRCSGACCSPAPGAAGNLSVRGTDR